MPWYLKLLLGVGASWAIVRFTAAVAERERVFTARSILWAVCLLLFFTAMGLSVYYYHLQEVPDETDAEETTTAASLLIASHPA
jgi:hypothetical protein